MRTKNADGQMCLFGQDSPYGRMSSERSAAQNPKIFRSSSRNFSTLRNHTLMLLDLRPGAGNMWGYCWEYDPVWLGPPGTLNTSECPKDVVVSSLSQILQDTVPYKYYLSPRACLGILRRAEERGKDLPPLLALALRLQAGLFPHPRVLPAGEPKAFAINQREEGRDLRGQAAALTASAGTRMHTFVTAGFLPESSASAGDIGYQEECAPTLKAGGKSAAVLCLNDQGGKSMECSENVSGTLRAQEHGHQPLVFESHGIDARYTGPHTVSPTISACAGTGGNNLPLVAGNGAPYPLLVRRLVPLECERLQGFPDGWTNLPGASDSARYKALGNSVAIPCVEHLMFCVSLALKHPENRYQI